MNGSLAGSVRGVGSGWGWGDNRPTHCKSDAHPVLETTFVYPSSDPLPVTSGETRGRIAQGVLLLRALCEEPRRRASSGRGNLLRKHSAASRATRRVFCTT